MNQHIKVIRTPDIAFKNLKGYPFTPNYVELTGGVRMHYIDEGKENKKVIFLLHGQPSWSYLYRKMIPQLMDNGYRVIAPDLIGFGKSDKPLSAHDHTFPNHVQWMSEFVDQLGIKHATAFMQDWGGMIGLRVLANRPDWLDSLVVANTALAEVKGISKFVFPQVMKLMVMMSRKPSVEKFEANKNFKNWGGYFAKAQHLEIGRIMQVLTTDNLSEEEIKAYDAPFPSEEYMAGPRTMPQIIATDLDGVNGAWEKLKKWDKPVLTLFSDKDPFLAGQGYDEQFQQNFKGAKNQPHMTVENASHFLQEDQATTLVQNIINWNK